jgi:hypothetical protein
VANVDTEHDSFVQGRRRESRISAGISVTLFVPDFLRQRLAVRSTFLVVGVGCCLLEIVGRGFGLIRPQGRLPEPDSWLSCARDSILLARWRWRVGRFILGVPPSLGAAFSSFSLLLPCFGDRLRGSLVLAAFGLALAGCVPTASSALLRDMRVSPPRLQGRPPLLRYRCC